MAIPTITSFSPATGPTGGHIVVEIIGTGFAMPTVPAGDTRDLELFPGVTVTFGGRAALRVEQVSGTQMFCRIPKGDAGVQSVVITNLDANRAAVAGESVTATFTYYLPVLTGISHSALVIKTLIQELKRQVTPNVAWLTNVDFTPDPSDPKAAVATFPSITIVGPTTNENRKYSDNGIQWYEDSVTGEFMPAPSAKAYDLEFTIVIESNSAIEIMSLRDHVYRFFSANTLLEVDCVPGDADAGTTSYELDLMWFGNRFTGVSSEDNLRRFAGSFVIKGVRSEIIVGSARDMALGMDHPTAEDLDLDGSTGTMS